MIEDKNEDKFSEQEAAQRRDAIVRAMIATPPDPKKKSSRPKPATNKSTKEKGTE